MRKKLIVTTLEFGQYGVPSPQNIKVRKGFSENEKFNLVIFDGRTIPLKSKVKCESSDVVLALSITISAAYLSAKIDLLIEDAYYKKPAADMIYQGRDFRSILKYINLISLV